MPLPKPVDEYATVQTWRAGLREQWGEEPSDWAERLAALERFCSYIEKDPDTAVRECLRESEGGTRISVKGRRFYDTKIAEWQASLPGDGREQGRAGNAVRSFLIHNGIFLQSGMQR